VKDVTGMANFRGVSAELADREKTDRLIAPRLRVLAVVAQPCPTVGTLPFRVAELRL